MTDTDNDPRLEAGLRQAYRAATVSPYLSQRVIAGIEDKKWRVMPGLKLAAVFLSVAALVIVLKIVDNSSYVDSEQLALNVSDSIRYPAILIPDYPDADLDIPGLSSLGEVPTLSHFHPPAVSSGLPGDFCIYQHTGELSC